MLKSSINAIPFRRFSVSSRVLKATPTYLIDPCCNPSNPLVIERAAITEAADGIEGFIKHTLCQRSHPLSDLTDINVYLKMEQTQTTGSFKERGARWALMNLTESERKKGVYAASAGNHAQALCMHGKQLGIPVTVVMPRHAPIKKIAHCKKLGGNVIVQGKNLSESRLIALGKSLDEGGKYINGYDHKDVIAGAGTVGLEIIEQVPDVDAVVLPAGGGGLVAGVATAIKGLRPDVKIISVEADRCPSFKNALQVGHPIETSVLPTLADGLAVPVIGVNAFATAKDKVDDAIVVDEKAIGLAILRLVELEKIVIEGAGACGVGALLLGKLNQFKGKKVVTVLSGGNIDTTQLGRVMERGMAWDNRLVRFKVNVSDRPGGISELTNIIAENGASIKDIFLERSWTRSDVFTVRVKIVAETRDIDHARELNYALQKRYAQDCLFHLFPEIS
ncbi:unnamed protein product, partial [Mesorhabditis belari]|uniref:Serine racemase n=1 Tax=Mesorhabditis belari TaxID=2138241 RepID=A0AAF3ELK7_9BILA